MRIKIKILFSALFLLFFLCSCGEAKPGYDITGYLQSFEAMDYAGMYAHVSSLAGIKEGDFVKKYSDIFSGIKITGVSVSDISKPDEDGTYTYTATYSTEDYGDLTNKFILKTVIERNTCLVLWDYSLIFPELEQGGSVLVRTMKAQRGEIFAADGTPLAVNSFADTVYLDTTKVQDINAVADVICPLTGVERTELLDDFNKALEHESNIISLGEYFKDKLTDEQKESILAVPGLGIEDDSVYMDITKVKNISAVADVICPLTGMGRTELIDDFNNAVEKGTQIITLGAYFKAELTDEQKETILSVQGLGIDDKMYTPIRDYPMGEVMAHIVGYTGYVSADAVPEGYSASDRIGKTGLEAAYESELRGKDGKIVYIVDRWGKNVKTLYEVPCEQGQDLRLAIDAGLQKEAYDALDSVLAEGQTGVAIVMDAETGYVQAMASHPSYNDNIFTFPISDEVWEQLNSEEAGHPLYPWATQGWYPPGSVMKPFAAAAELDEGAITENTVFEGNIVDNKWKPDEDGWTWEGITRVSDSGTPLKLYNAMLHSDNIYFAFAAMRLGDEKYLNYLHSIGMDEAIPFDLSVKTANIINADRKMDRRLLADMGYGQGQLAIAPIQMAAMYTAFANGMGDMMQPILVEKLCRTEGSEYNTVKVNEPTVWKEGAISKSSLQILTPIMKDVIDSSAGTGHRARISGVSIAGKTGTAEIGNDKSREISWFAGYWLDGSYDRLVLVMVDVAADGGGIKFDIAKKLLYP